MGKRVHVIRGSTWLLETPAGFQLVSVEWSNRWRVSGTTENGGEFDFERDEFLSRATPAPHL